MERAVQTANKKTNTESNKSTSVWTDSCQICTRGQKKMHEDTFARTNNFARVDFLFFISFYFIFITITVTPNPYLRMVT